MLVFPFFEGAPQDVPTMPLGEKGISVRAVNTQVSQKIDDIREDPDYLKMDQDSVQSLSELDVPIIVAGKSIGVLNLESPETNAFSDDDLKLLETLASYIGVEIQRIRYIDRLNEQSIQLRDYNLQADGLLNNASALAQTNDLDEIINNTERIMSEVFGFDNIIIGLVDGENLVFRSLSTELEKKSISLLGRGITARTVRTGKSQLVNDTSKDPDYVMLRVDGSSKAELCVPIIIDEKVVGVIDAGSGTVGRFTRHDQTLIELFSKHVSSAFINSKAHETEILLREREHELAEPQSRYSELTKGLLEHASTLLDETDTVQEILDKACRAIENEFGYERISIGLVEDDIIRFYSHHMDLSAFSFDLSGKSVSSRAYREKRSQYVPDISLDPDHVQLLDSPPKSALFVPIIYDEIVVGILNVSSSRINDFTEQDQNLIELFSTHIASAILSIRNRELQNEFQKLSRAVEQSANAVIITDLDGHIEYVNPRFSEVTGYSSEEAIGQNPRILKTDNLPGIEYKYLWDTITNGGQYRGEFHNLKKNGESYWASATISPVRDTEGTITHFVGIQEDITDRKAMEQSLEKRINELSILNQSSDDLITNESLDNILLDTIQYCKNLSNSQIGVIAIYQNENLQVYDSSMNQLNSVPRNIDEVTGIWGYSILRSEGVILNNPKEDYRCYPGSEEALSQDCEELENILSVPIQFETKSLGVIYLGNKPEDFDQEDYELVEVIANNLSSQLVRIQQQDQLEKQNKQLKQLDELKSRFLVTATHELRTPVTAILGYIDFMVSPHGPKLDDPIKNDLSVVLRNAKRLVVLTNDLLDIQRIETGRLQIHIEEMDIVSVFLDGVEELERLIKEKGQKLVTDIPDSLIMQGDSTRMSQVFINLIRNANKFTPEGGEVKVSISSSDSEVAVTVKDSGIGISVEDQERLFTPFPGINHGLNVSSSGLGLSICKGIVDLHGGKIWAESDGPGKGTTFTFTAPLKNK